MRTVRIMRYNKDSQYLPQEVIENATIRLSSVFNKSGQPLSGLSREEEEEGISYCEANGESCSSSYPSR